MTIFLFVFKSILGHAFPAYNVVLVEDLSVEYRFAKDHGNKQEANQYDPVGNEFFQGETGHGGQI